MAGSFTPTPQQLEAIQTTGRSVLVSAAAGSGKTAVLAERCAYLVCDAPQGQRCSVDELLVLTFTDAAAAEMRSRIVDSIRRRAAGRPADARLQEQLARVETAQISTIHSFCLWLVRRWFSEIGVDPSAAVMDAEEASLLKKEVLEALFAERYAAVADPKDPLGTQNLERHSPTQGGAAAALPKDHAIAFARLVDDYGLGEDRWIAGVILRLYEFTISLPDWRGWLTDAVESVSSRPESVLLAFAEALALELRLQAGHCRATAATLAEWGRPAASYESQVRDYADQLEDWLDKMAEDAPADGDACLTSAASTSLASWAGLSKLPGPVRSRLRQFERVRQDIAAFEFGRSRPARGGAGADEEARAAREAARKLYTKVKDRLFRVRLRDRFGLFSVAELAANLTRTQPYVETLTELVTSFHEAYAVRKRRLNVLDFADLERFAFDLLHDGTDHEAHRPSEVARTIHQRFAHVLVDEFQDINPVQQAILQLVSRESDPLRPNNLFAVGDVKQSIYRFRLAEPRLFVDRLRRFQRDPGQRTTTGDGRDPKHALDQALFLQSNFRSRPSVLDAVNAVFRGLMGGGLGDIEYGPDEELRPGLADVQPLPDPVEVHVLDRVWNLREGGEHDAEVDDELPDADSVEEEPYVDLGDPAQWTPIEREAYLVGTLTRQWLAGGSTEAPRRLRDVVVLLRAAKVNAERMAAVLQAMGVPAYAQIGGSLFAAREVRDVTAAMRLLDNPQQDVPAAAVLRSGILGLRLSADELAEIRLLDRGAPFHETVWRYGRKGPDDSLRRRLSDFAMTVDRYRDLARRRPLPETLWSIYENQGFLAYVCGLPNGPQRRANLLRVHDLARRFSIFRRQGLHRFLQFLESLEADSREMEAASGLGESEDVVRIMSIHQSKGLEFPLVFVAGLGNQFHLGDRKGRIIFERGPRIGLRVVDTTRMIEYPTAAHHLVAAEVERTTREEEMRVLYVAMTRAKDKLVLIGSCRDAERWAGSSNTRGPVRVGPTPLSISTAASPLDWLLPIVTERADGAASTDHASLRSPADERPLFSVRCYLAPEMSQWGLARVPSEGQAMRRAIAHLDPMPVSEPIAVDDPQVENVRSRVEYVYPRLATSSISATLAASEFGRFKARTEESPAKRPAPDRAGFPLPPSKYASAPPANAAYRGTLTHRVLQHLNFAAAASGVRQELGRLVEQHVISPEDQALIDIEGLTWFLSTPLADRIRRAGSAYRREFRFIAMEPLEEIDPTLVGECQDHVLVRGIVDGVLAAPEGLTLIDFKTDAIAAAQVAERAAGYEPQLRLYARAALKLWRRPIRECLLVFLTPRQVVSLNPGAPGSSC